MRRLSTKMNAGVEVPYPDRENYVARMAPIIVTNTIRAVMNPRCPLSKRSLPMQAVLWSGPRNETISASSVPDFCTILLPEPIGATLTSQLTRRTCVR
jgi:hypothetical protein